MLDDHLGRMRAPADIPSALVIDDYEPNRALLEEILSIAGFQVFAAGDGSAALTLLQDVRPSVILLDLRMPGLDGFGLLDTLKSDPQLTGIPVVVVTGDRRARVPQAAAVIQKPFGCLEVMTVVGQFIPPLSP